MLIDELLTEKTLIDDLQLSTTSVSPGSEQSPLMQVLRLFERQAHTVSYTCTILAYR